VVISVIVCVGRRCGRDQVFYTFASLHKWLQALTTKIPTPHRHSVHHAFPVTTELGAGLQAAQCCVPVLRLPRRCEYLLMGVNRAAANPSYLRLPGGAPRVVRPRSTRPPPTSRNPSPRAPRRQCVSGPPPATPSGASGSVGKRYVC
jgi:hypothetical protein